MTEMTMELEPYNPKHWYWQIGDDASRFWSSADQAYVADAPQTRRSRIANEVELYDVLAKSGLASRAPHGPFSAEQIRDALLRIDAGATADAVTYAELAAVADEIGFTMPPT